ncbi:uncharacterized protein BDR25DRAFT_347764 [Lindgomyces ingoldianus]|uniref:Uncharacterized protein n=1 Tax=Lindgomyces ingoldianus TaxID=673940 RepID=A0ACB6REB7_9PLEO|nr:uncharacterized protein BDR25DRAFT_347764 [Lindgomyces ingoldianus]KAF2477390.1 hypothetical protein BDR25DRAFT_347764 [Lindgomyces ingoldianus]
MANEGKKLLMSSRKSLIFTKTTSYQFHSFQKTYEERNKKSAKHWDCWGHCCCIMFESRGHGKIRSTPGQEEKECKMGALECDCLDPWGTLLVLVLALVIELGWLTPFELPFPDACKCSSACSHSRDQSYSDTRCVIERIGRGHRPECLPDLQNRVGRQACGLHSAVEDRRILKFGEKTELSFYKGRWAGESDNRLKMSYAVTATHRRHEGVKYDETPKRLMAVITPFHRMGPSESSSVAQQDGMKFALQRQITSYCEGKYKAESACESNQHSIRPTSKSNVVFLKKGKYMGLKPCFLQECLLWGYCHLPCEDVQPGEVPATVLSSMAATLHLSAG